MKTDPVFAVIGIRTNGSRLVIAEHQSELEATALLSRLVQANAFSQIVIEAVDTPGGHDTVDGEFGTIEM